MECISIEEDARKIVFTIVVYVVDGPCLLMIATIIHTKNHLVNKCKKRSEISVESSVEPYFLGCDLQRDIISIYELLLCGFEDKTIDLD